MTDVILQHICMSRVVLLKFANSWTASLFIPVDLISCCHSSFSDPTFLRFPLILFPQVPTVLCLLLFLFCELASQTEMNLTVFSSLLARHVSCVHAVMANLRDIFLLGNSIRFILIRSQCFLTTYILLLSIKRTVFLCFWKQAVLELQHSLELCISQVLNLFWPGTQQCQCFVNLNMEESSY